MVKAGDPATIHLYSDCRAAVVTRASGRSVWVREVATGPMSQERDTADGELPVMVGDGRLDAPVGEEERYTLYTDSEGKPYATKGDKSVRVRFERSRTRIDYRV